MITLYHTPLTCSTATHIALEEAGAEYDAVLVKLWKPEAHDAYREINPLGSVPSVRFGDTLMTENVALMTYIAMLYPDRQLMPADPLAHAQCLSFMAWLASSVQIGRRQLRAPQRFTLDESAHDALKAAGKEKFLNFLSIIDKRLEGRTWVMGDQFTVADGYALVFYQWGMLDGLDMAFYAHFTAFKDRMLARPAVRRVLEDERCLDNFAPKDRASPR